MKILANLALILLITFITTYNALTFYYEQYGMTEPNTTYFCEPALFKMKCQKVLIPNDADTTNY